MKKKYINIGIFIITFSMLTFCFYLSQASGMNAYKSMVYSYNEKYAIWSLLHIVFGISIGAFLTLKSMGIRKTMLISLIPLFIWEAYEGILFEVPIDTLVDMIAGWSFAFFYVMADNTLQKRII